LRRTPTNREALCDGWPWRLTVEDVTGDDPGAPALHIRISTTRHVEHNVAGCKTSVAGYFDFNRLELMPDAIAADPCSIEADRWRSAVLDELVPHLLAQLGEPADAWPPSAPARTPP
jgi:hypothetical protein